MTRKTGWLELCCVCTLPENDKKMFGNFLILERFIYFLIITKFKHKRVTIYLYRSFSLSPQKNTTFHRKATQIHIYELMTCDLLKITELSQKIHAVIHFSSPLVCAYLTSSECNRDVLCNPTLDLHYALCWCVSLCLKHTCTESSPETRGYLWRSALWKMTCPRGTLGWQWL